MQTEVLTEIPQKDTEVPTETLQKDFTQQATNPAPTMREITPSVWPLESLSLNEHVLPVNSRKKPRPRLLSSLQRTRRNNRPHHLILTLPQQ